jgi:hypothetical protein
MATPAFPAPFDNLEEPLRDTLWRSYNRHILKEWPGRPLEEYLRAFDVTPAGDSQKLLDVITDAYKRIKDIDPAIWNKVKEIIGLPWTYKGGPMSPKGS